MIRKIFVLTTLLVVSLLIGCTGIQPLPIAARGGDTIVLALGSQDEMTVGNTAATFTPDSTGIPVALSPKSIFNMYPDKRSGIYEPESDAGSLVYGVGHEQWITVMVMDLPQGLPVGFGTIKITTTAQQPIWPNALVENVNYRLEVLSGVGQAHGQKFRTSWGQILTGSLGQLQRIPGQVLITPPPACSLGGFAAVEMRFQLPFTIEPYSDIEWFRVVADDLSTRTSQKTPAVTWSASGTELKVVLMNVDGAMQCYEVRFSLVPRVGTEFTPSPQLVSVSYFDKNGAPIAGPDIDAYQVVVR